MAYRKINLSDYIGKRFGRLVIIGRSLINGKKGKGSIWDCQCDCGKKTQVKTGHLFGHFDKAKTRSCGCLHDENSRHFRAPGESGVWKLYKDYQYNAKQKNTDFKLTFEEFKKITSKNCVYCGTSPVKIVHVSNSKSGYSSYPFNGIDKIDPSKGYIPTNVEPCCFVCNILKRNFPKKVFLKHIALIYKRHEEEIKNFINDDLPSIHKFIERKKKKK